MPKVFMAQIDVFIALRTAADTAPEVVAEAAARAVLRPRPHHYIPGVKTRLRHARRFLPAGWRRRVTRPLAPV